MKKTIFSCITLLTCLGINAQSISTVPGNPHRVQNANRQAPAPAQAPQSFYTDYDFMDEAYNVDTVGGMYNHYLWMCNMNYQTVLGDTNFNYPIVDFSNFWDSYNPAGPVVVPATSVGAYTIDSVFILCGHENNSGNPDTIIINILALNAAGYPQQNTVLDRDTIIATQFNAVNDWYSTGVIGIPIGYFESNGTARFAVRVEYYGARIDTFGVLAGFGDLGPGNCAASPTLPNFPLLSHHVQNSYRLDMQYLPYGLLPTSTGVNTYYECNGQPGQQAGQDAENFLQNWSIWTRITADSTGLSVNENTSAIHLQQNAPNPSDGITTIGYTLAHTGSNVMLEVYDLAGQLVETVDQGTQVGVHTVQLNTANYAAGVYFYTLNVDGVKVTKRMVIAE